jgi:hypothetical protein
MNSLSANPSGENKMTAKLDIKQEQVVVLPAKLDLDAISTEVLRVVGGKQVKWKPAPASVSKGQEGHWRGLDYIRAGSKVRQEWEARWPPSVAIPAWDLVGRVQIGQSGCWEWVLVKIFQNPDELIAGHPPQQPDNLSRIEWIIEEAKNTARAPAEANWISAGFDVTTFIIIRAFLSSRGACGRMVFLCLGGEEWLLPIEEAKARYAIGKGSAVSNRLRWTILHL